MDKWTVAEAKAKLSEVMDRAMAGEPQTITRNGRTAVVVIDAGEWKRRTERKGTLAEFLAASPLRDIHTETAGFARIKGGLRDVDFG